MISNICWCYQPSRWSFVTAIWPLIQSLILSFRTWRLSRSNVPGPFIGFENYEWALFEEPAFWNATWVTTLYTILTVGLTVLIALGIALLLAPGGQASADREDAPHPPLRHVPCPRRRLLPIHVQSGIRPVRCLLRHRLPTARRRRLARRSDARVRRLRDGGCLGLDPVHHPRPDRRHRSALPKETIEAAYVDGASAWQAFRDVTLPQLMPVLAIVTILKSIFSIKTFDQIYMLTNGGPGTATQTLAHYAYFNGFKYYDMGFAASDRLDHGPADDRADVHVHPLRLPAETER